LLGTIYSTVIITTDFPAELKLPTTEPEKLKAAVRTVLAAQRKEMPDETVDTESLIGRLPSATQLQIGARQSMIDKKARSDLRAAEYFQSLLELGYLIASADGLADEEREALAQLVEHATLSEVEHDALLLHFKDLDDTSEALGRRERLKRVAANLDSSAERNEALSFAALVAIADGILAEPEMKVLLELGEDLSFSKQEVLSTAQNVADSIAKALNE